MIYLVIGLFVALAVGAFLRQQNKSGNSENNSGSENEELAPVVVENESLDLPDDDSQNENGFVLSARPVTDADTVAGATYSSHAPAGEESPYGLSTEPKKKAQAQANLLRWCGRSGSIQINNIVVPGPVVYWSNGECATPEPSCIDVTLPIEFPKLLF